MADDSLLKDLGAALHARLLAGDDPGVTAEISESFFPILCADLKLKFSRLPDQHQLLTVAGDALLSYFDNPNKFDPAKGTLLGYLYRDAYWNVIDKLRVPEKSVELDPTDPEHITRAAGSGGDPEAQLLNEEAMRLGASSPAMKRMFAVVTDPVDRRLVELMMDRVRETEAYAEVLGIQHLAAEDQAKTVRRHKDRLKKLLRYALKEWDPRRK